MVAAVLLAIVASGCADEGVGSDGPTSSTVTAGTAGPDTTEAPEDPAATVDEDGAIPEGSGCDPGHGDLPDGQWFGTVVDLTPDELELNLACWFIGEDAALAAEEDGEESPPPNDYYVRDTSAGTIRVGLAPEASTLIHRDGSAEGVSGTVDDLITAGEERGGFPYGVWIEVVDGAAVSVHEQWVP